MTAPATGQRTALITGASQGIGLSISHELVRRGWWVGMVARDAVRLAAAAEEIGGVALPADASSEDEVGDLAARVVELTRGAPDAIVNSAGAFSIAPVADTEVADFDRQISTNVRAPFLVIRAFLPGMLERRAGHIVNIGSIAGRIPLPGNAGYAASKYALRGLHEVLAEELRGTGVRATLIEPAATDTPLWDPFDPDRRDDLPDRKAMMRPEAVARAVVFAIEQPNDVEISLLSLHAAG